MRRVFLVAAMLASFVCVHCVVAQEQPQPAVPQDSAPRPHIAYLDKSKIVYVTPFDASPASNEGGEQVVEPPHTAKVMADDLLHELKKLGYKTKPIGARDPRTGEGILVTGAFTQAGTDGKLRLSA